MPAVTDPDEPKRELLPGQDEEDIRDAADNRTSVIITHRDPYTMIRLCWRAVLNLKQHRIYRQGTRLVFLQDEPDGSISIQPLTVDHVRGMLFRAVRFVKLRPAKRFEITAGPYVEIPADSPPKHVPEDMLAYPHSGLPELAHIQYGPLATPAGKVVFQHGYHADVRSYIHRPGDPGVPPFTVDQAVRFLGDWLSDFPFRTSADFANSVAFFLLPTVRHLIDGPTPFHYFDAPTAGTGKSILNRVLASGGIGRRVMVRPWTHDETELRKEITTIVTTGTPVAVFDNISGKLASPSLDAAITAGGNGWASRLLGTQRDLINTQVRTIWSGSANNAVFSTDMLRRSIRISLVRKGAFHLSRARHPNIEHYTDQNRHNLAGVAKALVEHWFAQGRPGPAEDTRQLPSFESWHSVIGGILECVGIPGFLAGRDEWETLANPDAAEWITLFERWDRRYGADPIGVDSVVEMVDEAPPILVQTSGVGMPADLRRAAFSRTLSGRRDSIVCDGQRQLRATYSAGRVVFRLVRLEPT